ncbi:MAG: hypothetical protein R3E65_07045 [Steroidobacteraceae bacterium]
MQFAAPALLLELQSLLHAEAVLLVDDREREVVEFDAFLEQCMRADHELALAGGNQLEGAAPRAGRLRTGDQHDGDAERPEPLLQVAEMLFCQQLRGRHQRGLVAAADRAGRGRCGDHGLAAADVALHQPRHRRVAREVGVDVVERAPLRIGQRKRQ